MKRLILLKGTPSPATKPVSKNLLVQKLPPSYDEERLKMIFENEKDQGGGPEEREKNGCHCRV